MSELQQSLESRQQEFHKQSEFVNKLQKLVAYQRSEIVQLRTIEEKHRSLELKTESLEVQLMVRNTI